MQEITKELEISMCKKENSSLRTFSFQERCGKPGGGKGILIQYDRIGCLSTLQNQYVLENHPQDSRLKIKEDGIFETLSSRTETGGNNVPMVMNEQSVRRLTPLECERLQGYPDGWTDIGDWIDSKGKLHKGNSDAPRYKALGNSIALPFWRWMAKRMVDTYDHPITMGSLFDGIGGFPLVYSECGCEPVWASEIEEFPIAVTKLRFPEEEGKAE